MKGGFDFYQICDIVQKIKSNIKPSVMNDKKPVASLEAKVDSKNSLDYFLKIVLLAAMGNKCKELAITSIADKEHPKSTPGLTENSSFLLFMISGNVKGYNPNSIIRDRTTDLEENALDLTVKKVAETLDKNEEKWKRDYQGCFISDFFGPNSGVKMVYCVAFNEAYPGEVTVSLGHVPKLKSE